MKKTYQYLALAVMIIIIIILAIAIRPKKVGILNSNLAAVNNAQAGTFVSANYPTVREDDKILGSKNAPLKIFVFEDYTLDLSAKLADTLDRIKEEQGRQIAIIVRPYFKNSSLAGEAAAAVDCAGEQGKWEDMRSLLFSQVKAKQLSSANLSSYVTQIGLKPDIFADCLTKARKSVKIEQSVQEAESYSVQGAPTMFVGEEIVVGSRPYDDFMDSNGDSIEGLKTVIERLLKENK